MRMEFREQINATRSIPCQQQPVRASTNLLQRDLKIENQ
jgi:hypothetical protein